MKFVLISICLAFCSLLFSQQLIVDYSNATEKLDSVVIVYSNTKFIDHYSYTYNEHNQPLKRYYKKSMSLPVQEPPEFTYFYNQDNLSMRSSLIIEDGDTTSGSISRFLYNESGQISNELSRTFGILDTTISVLERYQIDDDIYFVRKHSHRRLFEGDYTDSIVTYYNNGFPDSSLLHNYSGHIVNFEIYKYSADGGSGYVLYGIQGNIKNRGDFILNDQGYYNYFCVYKDTTHNMPTWKTYVSYDNNGNITSKTDSVYNSSTQLWQFDKKTLYFYDYTVDLSDISLVPLEYTPGNFPDGSLWLSGAQRPHSPLSMERFNNKLKSISIYGKHYTTEVNLFYSSINNEIQSQSLTSNTKPFKIYPNPAYEYIYLFSDQRMVEKLRLRLYNLNGILLRDKYLMHNERLYIGDLPSGLYNIHLEFEHENQFLKFVIK